MKRISSYRSTLAIVASTVLMIMPLTASAQPQLADDVLLQEGKRSYDRLPTSVGLEHAPLFAEAVRYLFAYEQRMYRKNSPPEEQFMEAMSWLSQGLDAFNIGKGDFASKYPRYRTDNLLQRKGLQTFNQVRKSDENGKIWDVKAFISASANLYAYLQVAPSPSSKVRSAFNWLQQNRNRLIKSGGKGDFIIDPGAWIPPTPKPGFGKQQVSTNGRLIQARSNRSKCLHKKFNNWNNGNPVHLWNCNAGSARMKTWIYEMKTGYIRSAVNPDKCLHKKFNNWNNGNPVHLWNCDAGVTAMKTWNYEPISGMIQSRENPNKCLHKKFNNWGNGNPIHLWDCDAGSARMKTWEINTMIVEIDS